MSKYTTNSLLKQFIKLTKVMLAKSIHDCFHCRSLLYRRTVLTGGFGQVCDNK